MRNLQLPRNQRHPSVLEEMICVQSLHLRFNKILLLAVGLWPYGRTNLVRLQMIFFYSILTSFVVFQFTTFATTDCTLQLVIEVSSAATFFIIFIIQYNMFCFNMNSVKRLLEMLQHTYDELKDENEVEIIRRYGSIAKRYTGTLTLVIVCTVLLVALLQSWSCILEGALFMNRSRLRNIIPIRTEYFVDQEKYFYLILIHGDAALLIGGIALIATATMILVYFEYACGMFKIASYRIEQAMAISSLRMTSTENANLVCKRIIYAVDIHRNAMEFMEFYMSEFNVFYLLIIVAGTMSLSLNMFREISFGYDLKEVIWPCIFLFGTYIYMFIANEYSQQIMDHSENLFITVYNIKWYAAPLHIQKLTLFLLQRGAKTFKVTIGGLFVGSLENAAMLTSASITYFTVLYSTRQ